VQRVFFPRSLPSLSFLFLSALLPAQQEPEGTWSLLYDFEGATSWSLLGRGLASVGDVSGDGLPDFAAFAAGSTGEARVYSGADGSLVHVLTGPAATAASFGHAIAGVGDLDGDGREEVLVGDPSASITTWGFQGQASVHRGSDGSVLYQYSGIFLFGGFGTAVAGTGDADGDGVGDFAIGEPNGNGLGMIGLYSGATGALIRNHYGSGISTQYGITLCGPGDLDGDGLGDLVVGEHYPTATATAYSGASGAVIWSVPFGASGLLVDVFDDWNGDGTPDVLVGQPYFAGAAGLHAGLARALSGVDGSQMFRIDGQFTDQYFGHCFASPGDLDDDGVPDLVVGQLGDHVGLSDLDYCTVYSGADRSVLQEIKGVGAKDGTGQYLAAPGDLDGDGLADLLTSAPSLSGAAGPFTGAVRVWNLERYLQADRQQLSSAAGGAVSYTLSFPLAAAGQTYQLLASSHGTGPVTLPGGVPLFLGLDSMLAMTYLGQYPGVFQNPSGTLDAAGQASAALAVPPGAMAGVVGRTYSLAAAARTAPDSWTHSSNVVRLEILP